MLIMPTLKKGESVSSLTTLAEPILELEGPQGARRHVSELTPDQVKAHLHEVIKSLVKARKPGPPPTHVVEELATTVWKSSIQVDSYLTWLEGEMGKIKKLQSISWKNIQELLDPLWRVDNELGPLYEELSNCKGELDLIRTDLRNVPATECLSRIRSVQDRLQEFEEQHVYETKFYPSMKWKEDGLALPPGQAVLSSLFNKCRNYAHSLLALCDKRTTDATMLDIQEELEEWSVLLDSWPGKSMTTNDMDDLIRIQRKVDDIDTRIRNGAFRDQDFNDLPGVDILKDLVEKVYSQIREILIKDEELVRDQAVAEVEDIEESGEGPSWYSNLLFQVKDIQLTLIGYLLGLKGGVEAGSVSSDVIKFYQEALDVGFSIMKSRLSATEVVKESTVADLANSMAHCYSYLGRLSGSQMDPKLNPIFLELEEIHQELAKNRPPAMQVSPHIYPGVTAEREESLTAERDRHLVYERESKKLLKLMARLQEMDKFLPGMDRVQNLLNENLCLVMM